MTTEANTVIFAETDLITLTGIPDWLVGYLELDSATGMMQAFNGTSKIPILAEKHMLYVKLLGYDPPLTDIADAERYLLELNPDGTVASTTQLETI